MNPALNPALNLDARQRAMLLEMGITVWAPRPAPAPAPVAAEAPATGALDTAVAEAPAPVATPAPAAPRRAEPAVARPAPAAPATHPTTSSATSPDSAPAWQLGDVRPLYPEAAQRSAPDGGWLVLLESTQSDLLAGDTGQLLNNMLRALRLQHHPKVWAAPLLRPATAGASAAAEGGEPLAAGLKAALATHHPARVLVLGLHAARAVLDRTDPLGPLRAQVHAVHGVPVVVSYDLAYLLRAPQAKAAAWADLCRAQRLGSPSVAGR